jgi:hypothetical protein
MDCYRNAFDGGRCPICTAVIQSPQPRLNVSAKMLLFGLLVPCKFASFGCERLTQFGDTSEHEDYCQFNYQLPCPYTCILIGPCSWRGPFNSFIPHLLDVHRLYVREFRSVARMSYVDMLAFPNYLLYRVIVLQDLGLSLLVSLSTDASHYNITVRMLQFSEVPYTVTVFCENGLYQVSLSKITMTRSLEATVFTIAKSEVELLCTDGSFRFNLTVVNQQI